MGGGAGRVHGAWARPQVGVLSRLWGQGDSVGWFASDILSLADVQDAGCRGRAAKGWQDTDKIKMPFAGGTCVRTGGWLPWRLLGAKMSTVPCQAICDESQGVEALEALEEGVEALRSARERQAKPASEASRGGAESAKGGSGRTCT